MYDLIARLTHVLQAHRENTAGWCVAYSGGLDSHVLLHSLAGLRGQLALAPVDAIHIHHGLSEHADHWASHCLDICEQLSIPLQIIHVDARPSAGQSPEEAARDARYRALAQRIQPDSCLLTAHHRRDQAETLMLQLLRGGGVQGTAAMPEYTQFARGAILRPLLDCNHEQLLAYATAHDLHWIDDDSNTNTRFDRNYLRHQVMPALRQRWPSVDATLARVARRHGETARLLNDLAATDLQQLRSGSSTCLDRLALGRLPLARQANLIRYWLKIGGLGLPGHARLDEILRQIHQAGDDAMPCISWPGGEIRRYRNAIYAMRPLEAFDSGQSAPWPDQERVQCPGQQGYLVRQRQQGEGVRVSVWHQDRVTVRYRLGGESCRPAGRQHHHALKKLFQEWGVPPWLRSRIPLLYVGEELAAIIGYGICAGYETGTDEAGYVLQWRYSD